MWDFTSGSMIWVMLGSCCQGCLESHGWPSQAFCGCRWFVVQVMTTFDDHCASKRQTHKKVLQNPETRQEKKQHDCMLARFHATWRSSQEKHNQMACGIKIGSQRSHNLKHQTEIESHRTPQLWNPPPVRV